VAFEAVVIEYPGPENFRFHIQIERQGSGFESKFETHPGHSGHGFRILKNVIERQSPLSNAGDGQKRPQMEGGSISLLIFPHQLHQWILHRLLHFHMAGMSDSGEAAVPPGISFQCILNDFFQTVKTDIFSLQNRQTRLFGNRIDPVPVSV
jgi:hypothetical protein